MGLLSFLFGKKLDYADLKSRKAAIIDVRSNTEYKSGHIKGSHNIPYHKVDQKIKEIKKWNKPVILCCASGNRSRMAVRVLKSQGIECYNGGSWRKVQWNWIEPAKK